jgi:3-oxoacyl-[acyl-carrier protein] reductase
MAALGLADAHRLYRWRRGMILPKERAVEDRLWTLILARELRGRDVTVNAVAPGPTATPLFLDGKEQSAIDHLAQLAPLERLVRPEDTAEVVAFLAGPARWVNGQIIYVNGGVI